MQVNCVITFYLTVSPRSEINILTLFIEIVKNVTLHYIFYIFILSHKDTYKLPLLAYSSANRGRQRKRHKVIQCEDIKKTERKAKERKQEDRSI